jgi:hypothetical protein
VKRWRREFVVPLFCMFLPGHPQNGGKPYLRAAHGAMQPPCC